MASLAKCLELHVRPGRHDEITEKIRATKQGQLDALDSVIKELHEERADVLAQVAKVHGPLAEKEVAPSEGEVVGGEVQAEDIATGEAPGIRQGAIGMKLSAGESVLTSSGRETTPFPKISFDGGNRKAINTVKRVDAWLRENAVTEARSRGDNFNLRQFESENPAKMPPSTKDSMEHYLFGEQPKVIRSVLKDIGAKEGKDTLFSQGNESNSEVSTPVNIPAELAEKLGRGSIGKLRADKLLRETVTVVESQDEARRLVAELEGKEEGTQIKQSASGKIQGFTLIVEGKPKVFLVKDGINAGQAFQVLLHEMVHAAKLGFAKDAEFKLILSSIEKRANSKTEEGRFWADARDRAIQADTAPELVGEEMLAYAIEKNRTDIGIVRRFIAMVKQQLVKMGFSPDMLSADDFKALAIDSLRAIYNGQADTVSVPSRTGNDVKFSKGEETPPGQFRQRNQANTPKERADLPTETRIQAGMRRYQDKYNRIRYLQEWLEKQGVVLSEQADVDRGLNVMNGKIADQLKRFMEQDVEPIVKEAGKLKISVDDIEHYLLAQHAPEANKAIQELHKDPERTAFGIPDKSYTDAEGEHVKGANEIMAEFKERPDFQELHDISERVRKFSVQTADMLVDAGIVSQDVRNAWNGAYKYYVPVRGGEEGKPGTSSGVRVSGKQQRRGGHGLREENVIENILKMREYAIKNIEKNKVAAQVAQLLMEANDDRIGTVGKPVLRRVFKDQTFHTVMQDGALAAAFTSLDKAEQFINKEKGRKPKSTFTIETSTDPTVGMMVTPMLADNEINLYVKGRQIRLQINDETAARALTNMGDEALGTLLSIGKAANNWFSRAYTGYDPRFTIRNTFRDFTAGMANLTGDYGAVTAAKIAANYPGAVREFLKARHDPSQSKWVDAYRKQGGSTGASWLPSIERLGSSIESIYNEQIGAIATYNKTYANAIENGSSRMAAHVKASGRAGLAGFHKIPVLGHFLKMVEAMNAVSESAFRIATFKTLVEEGKSEAEAGEAAKNSTINFDKKGELGAQMGALWLFFNPAVQGIHRTGTALFKSKYKGQAQAMVGSMALVGFLAAEWAVMVGGGDDDEWRKIPRNVKNRNLVIAIGDGKQITIPLPYEYGSFVGVGYALNDLVHGRADKHTGLDVAGSIIDGLSPIGNPLTDDGEVQPLNMMPTLPKILLAPTMNLNSFGSPIQPQKRDDDAKPDSQNMWRLTKGTGYDKMAGLLNEWTGGSKYTKGAVDVSPEVLKYYTRTVLGGASGFIDQVIGTGILAANGETPEIGEIPMVSVLARATSVKDTRAAFWSIAKEAKEAVAAYNTATKAGDRQAAAQIKQQDKDLIDVADIARTQAKLAKAKRDAIDAIRLNDRLSFVEKRERTRTIELEEMRIYDKLISKFNEKRAR